MISSFIRFWLLILLSASSVRSQVNCDNGIYFVSAYIDIPTTTYIYECQNDTLFLALANVTMVGVDNLNQYRVVRNWGYAVDADVLVTPNDAALDWNARLINTCRNFNGNTLTNATCQYVFQVDGFTATSLNYENAEGNDFKYSARIRLFNTGGTCPWQFLSNVTIELKDCNEFPRFDSTTVTNTSIVEYTGTSNQYAGSIANLLVTDPDVFNDVYGNVTLSIASITRPGKSGEGVDPTPFFIDGQTFVYRNDNKTILRYDVSRCPVVSTCLAIFDSWYDTGSSGPSRLQFNIRAIDGGGLSVTRTLDVYVTETLFPPVFQNIPSSVSVKEDAVGAMQIYPIQYTINRFLASSVRSVSILNIQPPVNASGGTYIDLTNCASPPPSPIFCSALRLTTLVNGNTFDYNLVKQYNISLIAIHNRTGFVVATTTSSLIINITPKNKQPILVPSSGAVAITEDVPTQGCVFQDLATIPQDPNNDTVFYYTMNSTGIRITGNGVTGNTNVTGMWYLNGTRICYNGLFASVGTCCGRVFRWQNYISYIIPVEIKDAFATPTPYPTFSLTVSIIKVDDPPVLLAPVTVSVWENDPGFIFTIAATQNFPANGTTPLLFNVTAYSTMVNSSFFYILNQTSTRFNGTAWIGVAGPGPEYFDFLKYPIITVNTSVTDGTYTVLGTTLVYVRYVNRRPVFYQLPNTTRLSETTTGYQTFWTVSTTDKENDPRIFTFVNTTLTTLSYFSIDFNLGYIYYVNPAFDFCVQNTYILPIRIRDRPAANVSDIKEAIGSPVNLTIILDIVRRPPTFTNPLPGDGQLNSNISFYENVTGQAFLFTLTAVDRTCENDSIFYNITDIRPVWNEAFQLPWGTNKVEYNQYYSKTVPMFNATIIPVYWIVVETTDRYALDNAQNATSTTTLTVTILKVPRPALWTSLPGFVTIREDVKFAADLYTVGATDPNNNNLPLNGSNITFVGITPTSGSTKFYWNSTTLTLSYVDNANFSFGIVNSYNALFTAYNGVGRTVSSSVAITIEKVNTGPFNSNATYYRYRELSEDTQFGQLLWDLRVQSNQSLSISYTMQDITPASGAFTVTDNGLLKLLDRPNFNYQKATDYLITILARDTGLGSGTQAMQATFTYSLSLLPVPKQPVITNLPNFVSMREGYPGPTSLYFTKCSDPAGGTVSYSYMVLPNSGLTYFTVNSGNGTIGTTAAANFTYLIQPTYLVVVYCYNTALTATGTLTVAIIWTTSTSTTTTTKAPTVYVTETTTQGSSGGLTTEQIGAIGGSLGGALLLAGIAFGIAQLMSKKAAASGLTANMKQPVAAVNELQLY